MPVRQICRPPVTLVDLYAGVRLKGSSEVFWPMESIRLWKDSEVEVETELGMGQSRTMCKHHNKNEQNNVKMTKVKQNRRRTKWTVEIMEHAT